MSEDNTDISDNGSDTSASSFHDSDTHGDSATFGERREKLVQKIAQVQLLLPPPLLVFISGKNEGLELVSISLNDLNQSTEGIVNIGDSFETVAELFERFQHIRTELYSSRKETM